MEESLNRETIREIQRENIVGEKFNATDVISRNSDIEKIDSIHDSFIEVLQSLIDDMDPGDRIRIIVPTALRSVDIKLTKLTLSERVFATVRPFITRYNGNEIEEVVNGPFVDIQDIARLLE